MPSKSKKSNNKFWINLFFSLYFDNFKNWIVIEDCPKIGGWLGPKHQYKNPYDNRRIDVQNHYMPFQTPGFNPGTIDATVRYYIYTTSRKASWNKYKTNHYLSLDIRTQSVINGSYSGSIITRQNIDNDNNTKEKVGLQFKSYHSFIRLNDTFVTERNLALNMR